jgi:hypothetical protein
MRGGCGDCRSRRRLVRVAVLEVCGQSMWARKGLLALRTSYFLDLRLHSDASPGGRLGTLSLGAWLFVAPVQQGLVRVEEVDVGCQST